MSFRCIITGCNFLDVTQKRWVHGDLHQLLNILVFNANGCIWQFCVDEPMPEDECCVRCDIFYEKNNVLVFPLELSQFNYAANKYLNESMRLEELAGPLVLTADGRPFKGH